MKKEAHVYVVLEDTPEMIFSMLYPYCFVAKVLFATTAKGDSNGK